MAVNRPVGNTAQTRELARTLAKHSHLDLQSCLAIVVLLEMGELGHTGNDLTEAFDEAMRAYATEVQNERLASIQAL